MISKKLPPHFVFVALLLSASLAPFASADEDPYPYDDSVFASSVPTYGQQRYRLETLVLGPKAGVQSFNTYMKVPGAGLLPINRHFYIPNTNVSHKFELSNGDALISIYSNGELFRADRNDNKKAIQDGSARRQWQKKIAEINECYSNSKTPVVVEIVEVNNPYIEALRALRVVQNIPRLEDYPIKVMRDARVVNKNIYYISMMSSVLHFQSVLSVFKEQCKLRAEILKKSESERALDLEKSIGFYKNQGLTSMAFSNKQKELAEAYDPAHIQDELKVILSQWNHFLNESQETLDTLRTVPESIVDTHPSAAWEQGKVLQEQRTLDKIIRDSRSALK